MNIVNHAPDHDTIEVCSAHGIVPIVTVYRDEDGEVHVIVNSGAEVTDLVLGREST